MNKVVFFGSGPVAAASLRLLLEHQPVEAVITKPTTLHEMSAIAGEIPVHTVANKKELDALIHSEQFTSKLGVLIDFGIIVSQTVIDYFPSGIINSHFSVLPQWRGADPINFAILSGQEKTGVSLILLTAGMDEGPLLTYAEIALDQTETSPVLTNKLIDLSNELLRSELPSQHTDTKPGTPQTITGYPETYSRKLTKEDGIIDWTKPAATLEREIRAFIAWPKSRSTLAGKDVIITSSHILKKEGKPGTLFVDGTMLGVYCGQDALSIDSLKPAGKKDMSAAAFLAGYRHLL